MDHITTTLLSDFHWLNHLYVLIIGMADYINVWSVLES